MKPWRMRKDLVHLDRVVTWLDGWDSRGAGAQAEVTGGGNGEARPAARAGYEGPR
jgi:hypothetical protein